MAGLPTDWSSPQTGLVQHDLASVYPWLSQKQGPKHRAVSLFAGIGGLDLGISAFVESVAFVENSEFCQEVLRARIRDGFFLDTCKIHGDVETFKMADLDDPESVSGLQGGFPCQGCSRTGNLGGVSDHRTSLLKHFFRILDESPWLQWMLLENVGNVLKMDDVMTYLIENCKKRNLWLRWVTVTGHEAGADVWRQRVFFLATKPGFKFFRA